MPQAPPRPRAWCLRRRQRWPVSIQPLASWSNEQASSSSNTGRCKAGEVRVEMRSWDRGGVAAQELIDACDGRLTRLGWVEQRLRSRSRMKASRCGEWTTKDGRESTDFEMAWRRKKPRLTVIRHGSSDRRLGTLLEGWKLESQHAPTAGLKHGSKPTLPGRRGGLAPAAQTGRRGESNGFQPLLSCFKKQLLLFCACL